VAQQLQQDLVADAHLHDLHEPATRYQLHQQLAMSVIVR
jgi:hypothetical protein